MSSTANKAPPEREHVLTTEEAALRDVALLVARGAPLPEIFDAAAEQVARVLGRPWIGVMRYDTAHSFVVDATWGEHPFPVGSRWPLDGPSPYEAVLRTGRPASFVKYEGPGTVAEAARDAGIVGAIAAPIVVDGVTWGVMAVSATAAAPIPEGAETRLIVFTDLVATAISNADARESLALLADEQAALRRVATLVARESSPVEIFVAVTEEACRVLASESVGLLRFDPDETATLLAQSETPWPPPPLGTRFTLDGENAVARVFRTAQTVRVDDWTGSTGAVAAMATVLGVRSVVAAPVVVEGRLWGTIIAATSKDAPLPAATESRLGQFTGLVATAIANAQARGELSRLAEEQAALRRIAVLVAQQPSPVEVFTAVTEAVGPLLGADLAAMHSFGDDKATVVASWTEAGPTLPVGTELPLDGDSAAARIFHSGAAARIDTYEAVEGDTAEVARGLRLRSTVGAPIVVEGKLWGALMAATRGAEPLPDDAEARIAAFTELVATAVSNAQARGELSGLAQEQAALRRVATLVARGIGPEEVFGAVAVEVGALFGSDVAAIVRFEDDGTATVLGDVGGPHVSGKRVVLDEGYVVDQVRETSRSARFDTDDPTTAQMPSLVRALGIRSSVASPIVVQGELWGAITAGSANGSLPSTAERRLTEFTELVATAVANTQAREHVVALADEQAALRRVATLVAENAPLAELFRAVAAEVGTLLGADFSGLARLVDGGVNPLAGWAAEGEHPPLPERWPMQAGDPVTAIAEAQQAVRWDDWTGIDGPIAAFIRDELDVRSSVGTPIVVEGRMWGVLAVHSRTLLPRDSELRMEQFTNLVATAVGNAGARSEVARLAHEQAALRRVATLVAVEASRDEIFNAIAREVAGALGEELRLVRYDGDLAVVVAASGGPHIDVLPLGMRLPLGGDNALSRVSREGKPVRIDDYSNASGPIAEAVRAKGVRSIVATPVAVESRTWGAMIVGTFGGEPVPPGTEDRLGQFAELMATSIANTEARAEIERFAAQEAALRRIATLVASGAEPDRVFAAVTDEVADLFDSIAAVQRFEQDERAVVFVGVSKGVDIPIGTRWELADGMASAEVFRTGRPARFDGMDWASHTGPAAEAGDRLEITSQVGTPIVVDGSLWGTISVNGHQQLPQDTEQRLEKFTEIVTTAVANAEARAALRAAADEQGALRRVATLVAASAAATDVFASVTAEIASVLGADSSLLCRADPDGTAVVVGTWGQQTPTLGTRLPRGGTNLTTTVLETGHSARIESYDDVTGGASEVARSHGLRSAVGAPILVEGSLWGLVIAGTTGDDSLAADAEQRLAGFAELVATAVANAAARTELVASRARIVAAGDEARRRIERNLHDGTQQRLIALGLDLQRARATIPEDQGRADAVLAEAEEDLDAILADLRELSHGLHPPLLARAGLRPSLRALARRSPIPVELEIELPTRPSPTVEIAVYYVVSEAMTNAIKHSRASSISVTVTADHAEGVFALDLLGHRADAHVHASIADDGVGGADTGAGSGLTGLADRVDALGGRLAVDSPAGQGTRITVELPLEVPAAG